MQATTIYDDEAVAGMIERLLTFGMTYQQAMGAATAAMDLAAAKHMDLQSASDIMGKAFMGNASILQRYGIDVEKSKDASVVFSDALAKVNEQFGGAATAQAETYEGTQKRLANATEELGEKLGGIVLPVLTQFSEAMIPVVDWIGQGIEKVQNWIDVVGKMPQVKAATEAVGNAFSGLQKWFVDVGKTVMDELGPALQELWSAFGDIWDALQPLFEALGEIWNAFTEGEGSGNILKDILHSVADVIKVVAIGIREAAPYIKMLAEAFKAAAEFVTPFLVTLRDVIGGFIKWLRESFEGFYNWLVGKSLWQDMWNAVATVTVSMAKIIIGNLTSSLIDPMKNTLKSALDSVKSMWDNALKGLAQAAQDLWNKLTGHSIWTEMLSEMVSQTQAAMRDVQSAFGEGLVGPGGPLPTIQAAQPTFAQGLGAPGAGAGWQATHQSITLPISVYLDGQQISAILERRFVDTLQRDAGRSRRG
jgi:phage-related protein